MKPALQHVIAHAVNTLPDSIRARKELLKSLIELIGPASTIRERLHLLIVQLETHEQNQLNLALEFQGAASEPKSATVAVLKNDGHGDGEIKP